MNEAAGLLTGEHDFSSFMSSGSEVTSTVRTLYELKAAREGEIIKITASANGFLYNMVRRLVAVLIKVGKGEIVPSETKKILDACDGTSIKDIVPACGLYMKSVEYRNYNK